MSPIPKLRGSLVWQVPPCDEEQRQGTHRAKHHLFVPHRTGVLDVSVLHVNGCDVSVKLEIKNTPCIYSIKYLIGFALEAHESEDSSVIGLDVGEIVAEEGV